MLEVILGMLCTQCQGVLKNCTLFRAAESLLAFAEIDLSCDDEGQAETKLRGVEALLGPVLQDESEVKGKKRRAKKGRDKVRSMSTMARFSTFPCFRTLVPLLRCTLKRRRFLRGCWRLTEKAQISEDGEGGSSRESQPGVRLR